MKLSKAIEGFSLAKRADRFSENTSETSLPIAWQYNGEAQGLPVMLIKRIVVSSPYTRSWSSERQSMD